MVLSRKKLKKKFRSLLAESLTENVAKDSGKDDSSEKEVNHELNIIRDLLITKSRKPKLLNRGKRGNQKKSPEDLKNGDVICADEGFFDLKENDKDMEDQNLAKKKKDVKKKKRRREIKLKKKGKKRVEVQEERIEGGEIEKMDFVKKIPEAVSVQIDESEAKKVYVGGIPYYSSEDDIRSFFEACGTVTEIDCMTFPESGKFRGIAILSFKTEGAAQRALALDGSDMGGFFLKIQPYKSKRKSDFSPEIIAGYHRVYVGNLSWDISEDDLKQFFSHCKITSIRFGADKETGDFKGFAHVDFADSVSLNIALKLDQKVVCGRPVRVRCAVPRKSGQTESSSKAIEPESSLKAIEPESSSKAIEKKQESEQLDGIGTENSMKKKKKRRTCYECGTPGHLSSECPQKRASGELKTY